MRRNHRWNIAPPRPEAADLARLLRTSPLIAQLLLNRSIDTPALSQAFLSPRLTDLPAPQTLGGLNAAAARVARAIAAKEPIVVYGDYDVDGITAVAILWHAIRDLGGDVSYYLPHRIEEGYGLNSEAIAGLARRGTKLVVTVDCGITAIDPAAVAREAGVDLIITDHHEWRTDAAGQPSLPAAVAIVHPRLPNADGSTYANGNLCGAGVAFKLAWGIGQAVSGREKVDERYKAFLLDATSLAALGTIADVVPLVGENRILTTFGLSRIRSTRFGGLSALIAAARLDGQNIDSVAVGFTLAPRLNACGRMGHAALAVELLTDASPARAEEIALFLDEQNRSRQSVERKILDEAIEQIVVENLDEHRAIVVGSIGWHPGVIGIVASRLVERYGRPAVVVSLGDDTGHGSARSISGFHVADALAACSCHLRSHGGHEMAAGLRLLAGEFEKFRDAFRSHANDRLTPEHLIPQLRIDSEAELHEISAALVKDLQRLGPFGQGNPRPLLACRSVELAAEPRRVGRNGDHLQLFIRQNGTAMKAIAFGAGEWFDDLRVGRAIDLAIEPTLNEWNGQVSVELQVKAMQLA